ncbi:MAG: 6-phosphofructokinase [Clostridia bacterium]|nr:6-phosphofructokinase [Clostridia bacterium]
MKVGVLTSGGDSPGMNAAIRAVVRGGIELGLDIYGIERGYAGLLDEDFSPMTRRDVGDILQRGGTILKTARCAEFRTDEGIKKAAEILKDFGILHLIVIGGDGSMTGALKLSKEGINVMCIPGTIDNDLGYTDFTIGFDTAVNTCLDAISKLRDTSSAHDRTTVVEVMGRKCGDIALYAGVAGGAEAVLLPEKPMDFEEVVAKVNEGIEKGKLHSLIITAEGYPMKTTKLCEKLTERTGKDTRMVVLSYLQRGGAPTNWDRMLATYCGMKAVELIKQGAKNRAVGISKGEVIDMDLEEALNTPQKFDDNHYEMVRVLSK